MIYAMPISPPITLPAMMGVFALCLIECLCSNAYHHPVGKSTNPWREAASDDSADVLSSSVGVENASEDTVSSISLILIEIPSSG